MCVCPVKIASTDASVWVTILANAPPLAISASSDDGGSPAVAPSWYSATMTSTSPSIWFATRLTASTGSPKSRLAIPPGLTSVEVSSVTAPITATSRPATVKVAYSGKAGVVVPLT